MRLGHSFIRLDRWTMRSMAVVLAAISISAFGSLFLFQIFTVSQPIAYNSIPPQTPRISLDSDTTISPQACRGPRATLYHAAIDSDFPRGVSSLPGIEYPEPTTGSYEALKLEKTWMSFEQRYGLYGFEQESDAYKFTKVDWSKVDWEQLVQSCVQTNSARFNLSESTSSKLAIPRFRMYGTDDAPAPPRAQTGRQAIVLRTWSTFEYTPEDMWNIRSLISEASLATGGSYSVVLLVDVKCDDCEAIHEDDELYLRVLQESVPEEFQSIAVLIHNKLQESWYRQVDEFRPFWQIMQPLQLFAHFYPEFDHYWQFEMDIRFTGDAGKMLTAFHNFGKEQPYKQAAERATWRYIPRFHGSYQDFSNAINEAMGGDAKIWGPIRVKDIEPIGPAPPGGPKDDNFEWGVGRDADLLLPSPLNDVNRIERDEDWIFRNWYSDNSVDRYMSVPAQARASYDLLEAIHQTQHKTGMRAPGEGTLPSHALWHGLKVVGLPVPNFQHTERDLRELDWVFHGGPPSKYDDGIAHNLAAYRGSSFAFFVRPFTWDWWSSLADPLYERWMGHDVPEPPADEPLPDVNHIVPPSDLPWFMAEVDGKIYAPGFMLHPRKTNSYRAPE